MKVSNTAELGTAPLLIILVRITMTVTVNGKTATLPVTVTAPVEESESNIAERLANAADGDTGANPVPLTVIGTYPFRR
jgi:hypothetical protein